MQRPSTRQTEETLEARARKLFRQYKLKYFAGRLSPCRLEVRECISPVGWAVHDGLCDQQARVIYLRARVVGDQRLLEKTLLHEMAHTAVSVSGHGNEWCAEMARLQAAGAPLHDPNFQRYRTDDPEVDLFPKPIKMTRATVRRLAEDFFMHAPHPYTIRTFLRWLMTENACGETSQKALLSRYPWIPDVFQMAERQAERQERIKNGVSTTRGSLKPECQR